MFKARENYGKAKAVTLNSTLCTHIIPVHEAIKASEGKKVVVRLWTDNTISVHLLLIIGVCVCVYDPSCIIQKSSVKTFTSDRLHFPFYGCLKSFYTKIGLEFGEKTC